MHTADSVTERYVPLLAALQKNPFDTAEELAAKAGISKPTALRRLRALMGAGDEVESRHLPPGKPYFLVKPILNYRRMGLEEVDVLVEASNGKAMDRLEMIAERHPYTGYRSRCFGSTNGLLMQFRIPSGASDLIHSLFENLMREGCVSGFKVLPTSKSRPLYTSMSTAGWDSKSRSWVFDWDSWFRAVPSKTRIETDDTHEDGSLSWMTREDVHIVSELMHDARRRNTEIMDALKERGVEMTPQTFGRHLQMIRTECISGYRVTFDPVLFEALSNILVCSVGDATELRTLAARTQDIPPPFESTQRVLDTNLFWFIRLPQSHIAPFLNNLFLAIGEMSVCNLDYTHSRLYYIWPMAYDDARRGWITEPKFMLEEVLSTQD